jgi:hypothetical protein
VQNVQKVPLRNPFKIKEIRIQNHGYFNALSEFLPIVNVVCKIVAARPPLSQISRLLGQQTVLILTHRKIQLASEIHTF